ncbi:rhomboid family intramembrane serine protease [Streptomyces sp. WMMC940]|uniref:rhomboid family intramembrane serine protease n=1 Tax=Streptomyces sp. WMMC940 TaxID=3015153 RepID=UPI0022B6BCB5|nr:rhomboid family intramembrane serine protease [Streptomyces sp. WMMC940]MCZ7459213.1 rhomboid family intramembrane serine protease [Streptomyces sp. WMMC940]
MDQAPGSPDRPRAAHGLPSCYRHPGRETGISCTRCERPICPDCMVSASVGFQCPECVRTGSGTGYAPSASRPRTIAGAELTSGDPRLVTKILLGVNAAVFLAVLADRTIADRLDLIGLAFNPRIQEVVGVADGEWYRLVTSMFLHQEIWHIAFNMLGLWWLGGPLEAALGRVRYLALYLLSGVAGSALVYLLEEPNRGALGASGAIWGLLGATAVLLRRLDYDLRPVIALLALNLLITFTMPGISWEAHVGGLVGGTVIAFGMVHAPRERRGLVQVGVCALVLVASVLSIVLRTQSLLT